MTLIAMRRRRGWWVAAAAMLAFVLVAGACSDDDTTVPVDGGTDSTATPEGSAAEGQASGNVLQVPEDHETIQAAVDAASPGDLILISEGTYDEAVDVTTNDIVIRGVSRSGVVLDGGHELQNGIRVLGADGVAVENMTAQNYTKNGFFWTTDVHGYRGSYLTAIRNGDYGLYAFGARDGVFEHSYGAGSPDAGFYIGQCYPCNALINDVISEWNGLGYSGTNSGGNLIIADSIFRFNRAGIVPNSGSYEGCAPERETTVVGNLVYGNSNPETAAIDAAILGMGNGILIPGGVGNVVERNRVWDHDVGGIVLAPYPEENPINGIPDPYPEDCLTDAVPAPEEAVDELPALLLWPAMDNIVRDNVVEGSGEADLVSVSSADDANRWCDNEHATTLPEDLVTLAPCEGELGDLGTVAYGRFLEIVEQDRPPSVDYAQVEFDIPADLEEMPDAETAPARPARDVPFDFDVDAVTLPDEPAEA